MSKQTKYSPKYQEWIDARKRHKLSHAHIQMARVLGMNAKKYGKLDSHKQDPWKAPLPIFIEALYLRRFGKERPEDVRSIEQMVEGKKRNQLERKRRKFEAREKSQQDAADQHPLAIRREAHHTKRMKPSIPSARKLASGLAVDRLAA